MQAKPYEPKNNDAIKELENDIKEKEQLKLKQIANAKKNFFSTSTFKGFRMSIASTIGLSKFLLEKAGFDYVLTRKKNQDPLEVIFN